MDQKCQLPITASIGQKHLKWTISPGDGQRHFTSTKVPDGDHINSIGHVLVEEVSVLLHVIGQQVCGGAHHEVVVVLERIQPAASERRHPLIDVQDGQHLIGGGDLHSTRRRSNRLTGIVNKDLERRSRKKSHPFYFLSTLSAVVAAVIQGCVPSNSPKATRPGNTFWFRFNVKMGTNIFGKCGHRYLATEHQWTKYVAWLSIIR